MIDQAGELIPFQIDHLDPLGQGVSRRGDRVTFIRRVLPGERGTASVTSRRKGVQFAKLVELEQPAENRQQPDCSHAEKCPGCHFLHTDYSSEIHYKQASLKRLLQSLLERDGVEIQVVPAQKRLGYRNRIQLHLRKGRLGLIDAEQDEIIEIPQCQLIEPALQVALRSLYQEISNRKPGKKSEHCELYLRDGSVQLSWNQPYAHGGFTQVNTGMNTQLQQCVSACLQSAPKGRLLELFAGDGNLTQGTLECDDSRIQSRIRVDFQSREDQDYVQLDLYKTNALEIFSKAYPGTHEILVLDPPRKGFRALPEWTRKVQPQQIIYVSCNPATLKRDLMSLGPEYQITSVTLLDMFPATYHFETVISLSYTD